MNSVRHARYRGHRLPAEVIALAVWLRFRFPLSLPMAEDLLAARGITVSHGAVWRWAGKFGRDLAIHIRRQKPQLGDIWRLDEVVISIKGQQHWLWRAADSKDHVLDALLQSHRDTGAALRLLRKLIRKQGRVPQDLVMTGPYPVALPARLSR